MSSGTLISGFSMARGTLVGVAAGGVASGIGSGILYVLSGLGYVYETTDRLETIVPLNMVWALLGAFAAPFLGGTPAGIVFVALLPLCAGAIIWHGLPHLEHAQLPTDMNEMPYPFAPLRRIHPRLLRAVRSGRLQPPGKPAAFQRCEHLRHLHPVLPGGDKSSPLPY